MKASLELADRMDEAMIDFALGRRKPTKEDNRKFAIVDTGNGNNTLAWCDNKTNEIFENVRTDSDYKPGKSMKAKFKRWATGFDV